MQPEIIFAAVLPFLGTTLGAAFVFFLRDNAGHDLQRSLSGFAAGVMTAASVWSLIIPAIEQSEGLPVPAFFPVLVGLWIGFLFLHFLEQMTQKNMPDSSPSLLVFAVALHNLPEGMAVGAAIAGFLSGDAISLAAVLTLSVGMAVQNVPEGAIISLPLRSAGTGKAKAFGLGALSGVIEPIGALLTIWLADFALPLLPYLLGFAAGAMLHVVVDELIPESKEDDHRGISTLCFAVGFTLMMVLDVALG